MLKPSNTNERVYVDNSILVSLSAYRMPSKNAQRGPKGSV